MRCIKLLTSLTFEPISGRLVKGPGISRVFVSLYTTALELKTVKSVQLLYNVASNIKYNFVLQYNLSFISKFKINFILAFLFGDI